ncbi:DUF6350 family protein [Corynebacterium sp.]|uniref:cell division protein PerM n=1 Tax=Corynebacterium sp. TaxID=1720 RepID=UPI0026E0CD09|nr:DUF6350 family protein [Corynebacterium sp.]MDO5513083.1 DUF6350 family protein [Corynebacterium sp.]
MPHLVIVLAIIAIALTGLLVTRTTLAALPATIAQLWLALNLAPVSASGTTLGVLPLLPTIGLVALVARRIRAAVRDRISMADLLVLTVATLLIPLVLTLIAAGMMWDAGRVFDVGTPPLGHAVARTLLVHVLALAIGMGGRLWKAVLRRYNAPDWIVDAVIAATRILSYLSAGALLLLIGLVVGGWARQEEVASLYNSGLGVAGAAVISLLYLPNAVMAAFMVMMGSEFHIGQASLSLYAIDLTPLPPLPLLALIPTWVHPWSILLLLVTSMAVAYVLGGVRFTVVQTLVSAVAMAVLILVLSYLTTGQVGYLGTAGPMAWLSAGLSFAWTAGIGVTAALVGKLADRRKATTAADTEAEPKPDSDPETEPEGEVAVTDEEDIVDGEVVTDEDMEPEPETEAETVAEAEADTEDTDDAVDTEEMEETETAETPEAPEAPEVPDSGDVDEMEKEADPKD